MAVLPEIPHYRVLRELGRGATARVFEAVREVDQSRVALKVFFPAFSNSQDFQRRIQSELRSVARLQHPNVVKVIESLLDHEPPVLVLEYVDGVSLADFQARLPYILPEVSVLILIEILKALEAAHEAQVIHRDLKPSNILVTRDGKVFVTDFGLAKSLDATAHTMSGTVLGSPDFMSPEQALGERVEPSSDLFSVAGVLYYLVTGTQPFHRPSPLATLAAVIKGSYEPVQKRNPKVSVRLARLIHRGLERDPKKRYESARDMRVALETYLKDLGLEASEFSLENWVKHPSLETTEALKMLFESLTDRCRAEIRRYDSDSAFDSVSHLSLVAPNSETLTELMTLVERMSLRKPKWIWIQKIIQTALPAIVFLILGIWWGTRQTSIQPTLTPLRGDEISSDQARSLVIPTPTLVASPVSTPSPVWTSQQIRKPSPRQLRNPVLPKTGAVRFDLEEGIEATLNGKIVNPKGIVRVPVGHATLVLRKQGFQAIEQEIEVKDSEPTVIRVGGSSDSGPDGENP